MKQLRLAMRTFKEVLKLRFENKLSIREIANSLTIARSTIMDYLKRAQDSGLPWRELQALTDDRLQTLLAAPAKPTARGHLAPDWRQVHQELKRKGVTLKLLWEEYQQTKSSAYQYSWFCLHYRQWAKGNEVWMPQQHKAGEELYLDYSGLTVAIWNLAGTKIKFQAELFVGTLGASQKTFCRAYENQQLENWIAGNCDCLEFFNGVPELLIPDNLKSAIKRAHIYEPCCNRTYKEMAQHYSTVIMPARSRRPRDKSLVENAVRHIQQSVLAKLRDRKFYNLEELNEAMAPLLAAYNDKPFQKLPTSRQQQFEQLDQPALQALPTTRYEFARWQKQTVRGHYHVEVDGHYYSVPYHYVRKQFYLRVTKRTIECFYQDRRVATHKRDDTPGLYTTIDIHRPEAHRQKTLWHKARLLKWAQGIGPDTLKFINHILTMKQTHLRQQERIALGVLRLSHAYSEARLEQALAYANEIGSCSFESAQSILKQEIDLISDKKTPALEEDYPRAHKNIRGRKYFH